MDSPFQEELACFRKKLPELQKSALGKFVLLKGDAVLGIFDQRQEAVKAGYERLGNVAFLIKQITDAEVASHVPAGALN